MEFPKNQPPSKEEVWRNGVIEKMDELKDSIEGLMEAVEEGTDENHSYFKGFNQEFDKLSMLILWSIFLMCLLLGLILWRVW